MIKNIVYLLLLNLGMGYSFQMKTYKNNVSDRSVLFYPNIINKQIPSDLYSNFISNIQEKDINVLISQEEAENQKYFIKNNDNSHKCIVAHSFAAKNAINFFESNEINKLVLIDPLDLDKINLPTFEMPKIPNFIPKKEFDNSISIENLESKINEIFNLNKCNEEIIPEKIITNKKVLVIKTKESSKWSFFPSIPPISILELDLDNLPYNDINIININDYGHFDIMDETWSNFASKFSKGASVRDYNSLNKYHEKLASTLNTFLNHD